jgi:outer membrane murein-binding lipoprotein Lpp
MVRPAFALAIVLLAGCARSEEARYTQISNDAGPALNAAQPDGDEDELAIGAWRAGLQDTQAVVEFGPAGGTPLFSISCDPRRSLLLQRHGAAPPTDLPVMLVTVGSETRRLAITAVGGPTPMLRGTLPSSDPFRSVLTGATTRIIVRVGDSPPLVLPPSPLIAAYAAQCESGENRRRSEAETAMGNAAQANETAVNVTAE